MQDPLYFKANSWDKMIMSMPQQEELDPFTGKPYYDPMEPLVDLRTSSIGDIMDTVNADYENITNEMKKRKKGSSNKYADPDPYDPQSQGSINNPYIEKRIDPNTGVIDDTKVIQRSDGSWVALTADEHKQLTDKLTADGIPIDKVSRIPTSQDMFEQQQLQNNNGVGVVNPNNPNAVNTTTTTTPTQGTTIPADVQAELDMQKEIQKQMPYGGRINIKRPDEAQYAEAMKIYQANEDAKKARYDAMVNEVQQYNSAADYENAKRQGYIPGTREYTSQEFKDLYGDDSMDSSGNHGLFRTKMQAPPAYAAGELPEKKYNTVEVFKPYPKDVQPRGVAERVPKIGLPAFGDKTYNSAYNDTSIDLFSNFKEHMQKPENRNGMLSQVRSLNQSTFTQGWNPSQKTVKLYGTLLANDGKPIQQGNFSTVDLMKNIFQNLDPGKQERYKKALAHITANGSVTPQVDANGNWVQSFADAADLIHEVSKFIATGESEIVKSMLKPTSKWVQYSPETAAKNVELLYGITNDNFKDKEGISNSFPAWLSFDLASYYFADKFGRE